MVGGTNQSDGPFFSSRFVDLCDFAKSGQDGALTGQGVFGVGLRSGFHVAGTWHDETGWGDGAGVGPGANHVGHVVSKWRVGCSRKWFAGFGGDGPTLLGRDKSRAHVGGGCMAGNHSSRRPPRASGSDEKCLFCRVACFRN